MRTTCMDGQSMSISISDEEFRGNYDEDSDKGYILEVVVQYPKYLHD